MTLAKLTKLVYNTLTTSHKGVVGFSSLMQCTAKAAVPPWLAAFSFEPPVLAARMGGRKPCRFVLRTLPGLLTRSSRRPCLAAGVSVLENRNEWSPIMAQPQAAACAAPNPTPNRHVLHIADAVSMLHRPLQALQAVEQLTHPTSNTPYSITLELVEREALGYLLTIINLDFQRVVADIEQKIEGDTQ